MPLVHHGYSVYISSDGEELSQRLIDVGQDVVRCKISRKAGMPFKIHVRDSGEQDKCIRVYVDGQYLAGVAARGGVSACLESVRTSAQATRAFLFAPSYPRPLENASNPMGTIEVRIVRAERTSKPPTPRIVDMYGPAKKVGQPVGHGHIILSGESESAVKATQSYRPTQSWDEPLVSFQFCYGPEELDVSKGAVDDDSDNEFEYDELDSDEEPLDISWASTPSASSPGSSQFPVDLTDSPATSPSPSASANQPSLKRTASLVDVDSDSLSVVHREVREPQRALIPGPSQRSSSQTRLRRHVENALYEDSPQKRRVRRRIEVNLKPYTVIETTRSARAKYNKRGYGMSSKKRRVKSPMHDA